MDMFSSRSLSYKLSSLSSEASASSGNNTLSTIQEFSGFNNVISSVCTHTETHKTKKRRGLPGNPGKKILYFIWVLENKLNPDTVFIWFLIPGRILEPSLFSYGFLSTS